MIPTLVKQYWWIILIVLALLVLQSTTGSRNKGTSSEKSEDLPYVLKRYLMSKADRSFFGVLEQVTDSSKYYIFPQVSLNNLVTVEKGTGSYQSCLLYTSDAADDLLCVDLGGRRIIK